MQPGPVPRWASAGVVLLLVALTAGCSTPLGPNITGSGTPATRTYHYSGFTGVRVDDTFAATVTRSDSFAVTVTADDNLVQYLRVEVHGDTLQIGLDPGNSYTNTHLKVEVTMPSLRALEVTGASSADVKGFASQDDLDAQLSGAGRADLTGVRAGKVGLDVSGGARLTGGLAAQELGGEVSGAGEGSATSAKLEASGAGRLDLKDFPLRDADLQLSGGASGTVRVSGTLNVEASGGAHLDYYGSPTIGRMDVSGGAQVNHAGS
jgi:hypothetical protein